MTIDSILRNIKEIAQDQKRGASLSEVFEYAGMLASSASKDAKPLAHNNLLRLAAAAVLVLRDGDKECRLAPDNDYRPCTHEEALEAYRSGVYVRGKHWDVLDLYVRAERGLLSASHVGLHDITVHKIKNELLSGHTWRGEPVQWVRMLEEVPF